MQHVAAYERLAAQAAVSGDRALVRKALLDASARRAGSVSPSSSTGCSKPTRAISRSSRGTRVSKAACSPSTAATRRPTSRSSRADGSLLALVRGPLSSPHHLGVDGCLEVLEWLVDGGDRRASTGSLADVAALLLAGVDFPAEEEAVRAAVEQRGWARRVHVDNDTFAVLRAGTERGWGVAITCGAGINCVGVSPDGRHARFPALGEITGDWGGGYDVGLAALYAAARSEDGRGPRTSLEHAVPAYFGLEAPSKLAEAFHFGQISQRRVIELAPIVLAEAADDAVAAEIVQRLAAEVVALARVALKRLGLTHDPAEVLLGGGVLQDADGDLLAAIDRGLRDMQAERDGAADCVRGRSSGLPCSGSTSWTQVPTRSGGCARSSRRCGAG